MTTVEAGGQGEQPKANPVQEARSAFNKELFGKEYHTGVLLSVVLRLQSALLRATGNDLTAEKIYHELSIVAGQGTERAQLFDDATTAETLQTLQEGFQLTYETFSPRMSASEAVRAAQTQPTRTADLPPMTSAKGGESTLQTQKRPDQTSIQQPVASTTQAPAEGDKEPQEETFGSFLRQKRNAANLSQAKLGTDAGNIKNLEISALELGRQKSLDETKATQIASALGLSLEDTEKYMALYHKQFSTPPEALQQ